MEQSEEVRDAWLRFCDRLSAADVARFDELVSSEAKLIIGTAPGEWIEDRERMRFGFETEGLRLHPDDPLGYAEGSLGWVVDRPAFEFPDGVRMHMRLTAIVRREDAAWRLVHAHFSVGVPDEEVVELQQRWGAA
jgi:hypothetical protein